MAKLALGPNESVKLFVVAAVKIKGVKNNKSKKNRQINGQMNRNTNSGLQNTTQNTKD